MRLAEKPSRFFSKFVKLYCLAHLILANMEFVNVLIRHLATFAVVKLDGKERIVILKVCEIYVLKINVQYSTVQ